jgi:hypothetical protein
MSIVVTRTQMHEMKNNPNSHSTGFRLDVCIAQQQHQLFDPIIHRTKYSNSSSGDKLLLGRIYHAKSMMERYFFCENVLSNIRVTVVRWKKFLLNSQERSADSR